MPRNSPLHALDPRVKIAAVGAATVGFFLVSRWELVAAIAVSLGGLIRLSRLPAGYVLGGLRPVWLLLLATLLANAFFVPGQPLAGLEGIPASREGLARGGLMAARLGFLVLLTSLLTLTTSPIQLTDGVEKMLAPLRKLGVPSHELAMVAAIALRFLPTLAQEADRIVKAQVARGACLDRGGPLRRGRALVPVLVPLFVSAFRHAEDLALAMEARCYRGGEGRTRLCELRLRARDGLAGVLVLAFLGGLVALERML